MAYVQHLSVRIPWHDRGWDGRICDDPLGNASCVLLENIGRRRDDELEVRHAGQAFEALPGGLPPCAGERGGFLSNQDQVLRTSHPYGHNPALKALRSASVPLPAWSVHAIPFRWLNRDLLDDVMEQQPVDGYSTDAEDRAISALDFAPAWVLHGDNQKAAIDTFFQDIADGRSLVFFYLKHAPFENHPRRVLVGAALVASVTRPGRWPTDGPVPFPNHMWETVVRHTLRPDGTGGILLPMQALARLAADGTDVSDALAEAPEKRWEFSYGTEHVPADTAVASLLELKRAAEAAVALGCGLAERSFDWLDEQLDRAWLRRGTTPGLPAVLDLLSVPHPTFAAREVTAAVGEGEDPWPVLERALAGRGGPDTVTSLATPTRRKVWKALGQADRQAMRLLARFDLTSDQVRDVYHQKTTVPLPVSELLADPYSLVTCTIDDASPIPFEAVDRGCFPDRQLTDRHPLPVSQPLTDPDDKRRVEAAMATVLLRAQSRGHTLLPLEEMLEGLEGLSSVKPLRPSDAVLAAHELRAEDLDDDLELAWPQLCRTRIADGTAAYKLRSALWRKHTIREVVDQLRSAPRHTAPKDLGATLDAVLGARGGIADVDRAEESRARQEKLVALREMYESWFTVLNGPAGTGKTTLVKALVQRTEVLSGGVLLLAPTGKARVQLQDKVGHQAQTLAQFLSKSGRYEADSARYRITGRTPRERQYGTVIVDEASMLTEDMLAALLDALEAPQRMILVGDPRQLPPIGAGRPFVDLERAARQGHDGSWPRVAQGWAELTVLRRQRELGNVRHDLMLARWYSGDEHGADSDEIWQRLRQGQNMATLRAVPWNGRTATQVVDDVLRDECHVVEDATGLSFATSYGAGTTRYGNTVYPDYFTAPAGCGRWQILSPVRGTAHGTVELNRHLKRRYRGASLENALKGSRYRRVPKPLGAEQIVLGDKVVHTRNGTLPAWSQSEGKNTKGYVANGELGVVTGELKSGRMNWAPRTTEVEFSSQPGRRYKYGRSGGEEEVPLELAWALTVHKSQGSEFETVVVVLPAGARGTSRELLYTALTRQTEKVIIYHEGPLDDLLELTRATGSDTARRFTDLMVTPDPRTVTTPSGANCGRVDARLVHVAVNGVMVRSKNEVIVAGLLEQLAPGAWAYEQPFKGKDGRTVLPDFTITPLSGPPVLWEHLGMLDDPEYAARWRQRLKWYAGQGVLPEKDGGGPNGTLVWTSDEHGVNEPEWRALAQRVVGTVSIRRARPMAVKKTAARPERP
ncbi:AAA family ATPase [Streptomyces fungicidicus]|uniref:AAA family ATPase n=1 Tax=Streptomyces fungicidicus TaxID=68203 RepID=UPI0036676F17